MKDKMDNQLRSFFTLWKSSIKTPRFPGDSVPVKSSPRGLGFSIGYMALLILSFVFFGAYVFLVPGDEIPLTRICITFIDEYDVSERLIDGIYYLQDAFHMERNHGENLNNIFPFFPYIKIDDDIMAILNGHDKTRRLLCIGVITQQYSGPSG